MLPELKEGDFVIFKDCGAYGYTMSSNYNGRPRPAEIVVDDGKVVCVKEKESPQEMLKKHFKGQDVTE